MTIGLIVYAVLMAAMLFAMMQFTASLLVRKPRASGPAAMREDVERRLLALDGRDGVRVRRLEPGVLEWSWDGIDPSVAARVPNARSSVGYLARAVLDADAAEICFFERLQSRAFFVHRSGGRLRVHASLAVRWGVVDAVRRAVVYAWTPGLPGVAQIVQEGALDTTSVKRGVRAAADACRWTFRPVLWPPRRPSRTPGGAEAPPGGSSRGRVRGRRFWGVVYPASYALAIAVLFLAGVEPTRHNVLVIAGISAGWWGVWGVLVWALLGFPRPRVGARAR